MVALAPTRRYKAAPNRQDFVLDDHPSEQELIASYLSPRALSGDKSCRFIHTGDVYAAHPADLTREHAPAVSSNGDEVWYFFTAVRARGGGRKARTVDSGEGWWHSEAGSKPVVSAHHDGAGYRQNFSFVTKEDGVRVRSGWLMVELGLHDDGQDEVTLCKVYFSPRAAAKNHRKPALKRKAADAPAAPAQQCHRRARRKTSGGSEMGQDDCPAEKEAEHANAGEQEGPVEPKAEDRADFYWWLDNKETVRLEIGMSKEEFYKTTIRCPSIEEMYASCPPVVPKEDQPAYMAYLTYDELYDMTMAKELLARNKILEEMRAGSASQAKRLETE